MNSREINGITVYRPTRQDITSLKVGDYVPDLFGRLLPIVKISAHRDDIHGKAFICYYTAFGRNSSMSHSMTEDEIVPTIDVIREFMRVDSVPW